MGKSGAEKMIRHLFFIAALWATSMPAIADYEYQASDEAARRLARAEAKTILAGVLPAPYYNIDVFGIACWLVTSDKAGDVFFSYEFFEIVDPTTKRSQRYYYQAIPRPTLRYRSSWNISRSRATFVLDLDKGRELSCHTREGERWYGDNAKRVADALRRLQMDAERYASPAWAEAFEQAAQSYRTASPKPEFPESARRFRVQAEAALRDKRFDDAIDRYIEALTQVPWWPEGRFNLALLLGELGSYESAMREMQRFLHLVPEAANARAAQDKIYEWEALVPKK